MSNEDGEKPVHPRRRNQRVRPPVKDRELEAEIREKVVRIYGEERVDEPPLDPDGVRPVNDHRRPRTRIRLGRRFSELESRIDRGEITMREFVKTLTPEELWRGQIKDKNGTFRGAPPKWIPAEFHQECVRELLRRGDELWRAAYLDSIKVFAKIANDESLDPKDRLKAAQYVIERVAGKTPERIEVSQVQPWEGLISGIVAEAEEENIARAAKILKED